MASIRKHPKSKYWFACITLPNGRQTQRSTKQTDAKKARAFADKLEAAGRAKLTEKQARKIVAEIFEMVNGEKLPGSTSRDFFAKWAANKKRETAEATGRKYSEVIQQFIAAIGKKADSDIADITRADVMAFRDGLASRLSQSTANLAIKIVRMALKEALIAGLVDTNVAIGVRKVKHHGAVHARRAFTLPELKIMLKKAAGEWRGLILFGIYTGQRLGDIAKLTWQNLDMEQEELAFVTSKTGRNQRIPLATPLRRYVEKLPAGDNPKQPLFPEAFSANRTGTLSNQFYEILVDAGLAKDRGEHVSSGKGRSSRRTFNELGFHALRHTATSLMKNAGISPAIVQDIIGHDSPAVSAHYTHIEEAAKRKAIERMPDLTRGK
jgi:integrase